MSKTTQVMSLDFNGKHYICVKDSNAKANPYKLYVKYFDLGWHRRKVTEYADFDSVLFYLLQTKYPVVSWDNR